MPCSSRNLPAGSVVHVYNRGNDKRLLFERARDFEEFLRLVAWAKAVCPVRIVAYCIMSNHWHFVFWVEVSGTSRFLHLTTTHAKRWRRKTDTIGYGHVYGIASKPRRSSTAVFQFPLRRAEPVGGGLCAQPKDWRWSSLAERLGNRRGILDPDPIGVPIDWCELVERPLPERDEEEIRKTLKRY